MPDTLPSDVEESSVGAQAEQDQVDASFRDITEHQDEPESQPASPQRSATSRLRASMGKSKLKWVVGGGISLAAVGGIAVFLFFLILFKNIHIKDLFLDYQFAKFNRAFSNRLEQSVNDPDANPTGSPDSTVQPTDSPEAAINDLEASQLQDLKSNPSDMSNAVEDAETLNQSSAGSMGPLDGELGIDDSIADETGKTDAQTDTDTDASVEDGISQGLESGQTPDNAITQDTVDETNNVIGTATTTADLETSAIKGFTEGINSVTSKASGPFVIVTIACIARDVLVAPGHIIEKIRFQGLARSSATINKYADCQKQGKCSLAQIGDIAQKFDNSSGSFTQACGYQEAVGNAGSDCTPPDPNYSVIPPPGSIPDDLVRLSSALDGNVSIAGQHLFNLPLAQACGLILKPSVQIAFGAVNIGASAVAAVTGVADFGLSDVGVASAQAASAVFASKAAKALALNAALYYGGGPFKRNFSGPDWGNIMAAGDKALSTATCILNGCRKLTPQENQGLAIAIHADDVKQSEQRGIAYRLFSPHNPTSTLGMLADRAPTSPQAMTAAIGGFFSDMMSPPKLFHSLSGLFDTAHPAWAATVQSDTYGIPDYGFTDNELNSIGVIANSRWVAQNLSAAQQATFDKCFDPTQTPTMDIITGDGNGNTCNSYNDTTNPDYTNFLHYRLYKLDQRVTQDLVLLYNNQDTTGGSYAAGTTSTAGCVNPFTNPAWGLSRTDQGVDYDPPNGQSLPVFAPCDGVITSTIGHGWPGGVYINFKLTSGPFTGKCIYIAEHLTDVTAPSPTVIKAGQQIATAVPGSPWTEWGWSAGPNQVSTPYPPGTPDSNHYPTEGGKAFARFIKSLGGPVRDDPGPGPLYPATGASCS